MLKSNAKLSGLFALIFLSTLLLTACMQDSRSGKVYSRDQARVTHTVYYGTILRVEDVVIEGTSEGAGTLAGGAMGGVLGSTIGGGSGRAIGVVGGAILGGLAGAVLFVPLRIWEKLGLGLILTSVLLLVLEFLKLRLLIM